MSEDPAPGPALPPPPPGAQPAPAEQRAPIPAPPPPPPGQGHPSGLDQQATSASAPAALSGPVPDGSTTLWTPTASTLPVPPGYRVKRGWRTTIAVASTILVLLIGVNLADASIPMPEDIGEVDPVFVPDPTLPADPGAPEETLSPIDPGPVAPGDVIDVGAGFTIGPPAGWVVVSQEDDVAILQKGATLLVIGGIPTADAPDQLAAWYRDAWFADGSYTGGEPTGRVVGGGIPAAELDYTGVFDGTQVDGTIVAASEDGSGLLINAFAPTGELASTRDDLEAILASVRLGG